MADDVKQVLFLLDTLKGQKKRKNKSTHNPARKSPTMYQIEQDLHPYFRNAYRMSVKYFYKIFNLIRKDLTKVVFNSCVTYKNQIDLELRLSMALCIFAGGSSIDLFGFHKVCRTTVYDSLWIIVDVINQCNELEFHFPTKEEQKICEGFKHKSGAGFDNVIGALDGMLVWTLKPSPESCSLLQIGEKIYTEYKKMIEPTGNV